MLVGGCWLVVVVLSLLIVVCAGAAVTHWEGCDLLLLSSIDSIHLLVLLLLLLIPLMILLRDTLFLRLTPVHSYDTAYTERYTHPHLASVTGFVH